MSNILLIHGAWGGAWELEAIARQLSEGPHRARAIDLPGHGANRSHPEDITMDAYVNHVVEEVRSTEGPVILAGHSLAGAVISRVAELLPEKIESLVYICAILPRDGESTLSLMESDSDGQLLPRIVFSEDQSTATVGVETLEEVFLHDIEHGPERQRLAEKLRVAQAVQPFLATAELSESRFGAIPKFYIRCSLDRILSPALQDRMIEGWNVERVFELEAGHLPILSMPEQVAHAIGSAVLAEVAVPS